MDIWIFGYGSLVYRPGFEYAEAVQGYIQGYRRVFWQGSTDHRGTPEAPGRTVTLHPDAEAATWGTAYRLAGSIEQQQQTLQYLEWREKQYDQRVRADVYTHSSSSSSMPAVKGALVYIATDGPQNVNWLGPAPLEDIARQAAAAVGPSGPNYEYVFRLADAMREMGVEDVELFQLEAAVRSLLPPGVLQETETTTSNRVGNVDISSSDPSGSRSPVQQPVGTAEAGSGPADSSHTSSSSNLVLQLACDAADTAPQGSSKEKTGSIQLTAVAVTASCP